MQILVLHHVEEDEAQGFENHLCALAKDHCFIGYSEAVERVLSGDIDKPYIAVSFDDGFRSCTHAAKIMDRHGVKGCFFVCPSIIDNAGRANMREFYFKHFGHDRVEFMGWDDVECLVANGHEVGSHGMSHALISSLTGAELEDEIGASYDALLRRLGRIDHFAWPYGRFAQFSAEAASVVFTVGFRSCGSALRGCHVAQGTERGLCLRRDHLAATWPTQHMLYFLARSAQISSPKTNTWPKGWEV